MSFFSRSADRVNSSSMYDHNSPSRLPSSQGPSSFLFADDGIVICHLGRLIFRLDVSESPLRSSFVHLTPALPAPPFVRSPSPPLPCIRTRWTGPGITSVHNRFRKRPTLLALLPVHFSVKSSRAVFPLQEAGGTSKGGPLFARTPSFVPWLV